MSLGLCPSCGLVLSSGWGSGISWAGRLLPIWGSCVHAGVSTVNMHAQKSRARVTGKFGEALFGFVVGLLFFVTIGRVPRKGYNGLMRPKAL